MLRKRKIYKTAVIILSLVVQLKAISQVSDKGFPSPNAAALGKYADYPVSYFTGVPAINIPLYTLKDGAATLPISLSYHASGIKVGEVASWVGLGWVLNAGGVITRTIKGGPDEGVNSGCSYNGYYRSYGLNNFPKLDMTSDSMNSKIRNAIDLIVDRRCIVDLEPDIYTFNVSGMVGKFIFDENRHPKFLTQSDIRISVDYGGFGDFQRWTITTTNGTKYIFGENGARESNSIVGSTDLDNNATTAWYLTKIIYPGNTDTLNFQYASNNYTYYGLKSEFTTADDSASLATKVPDGSYIQYRVNEAKLSSIKSKNIEIDFVPNFWRYDISGGSALGNIYIKNSNTGKLIDQVKLFYDYFNSTTNGSLELGRSDTTDTKRLKLTYIQKGIDSAAIQPPPYKLEYYEDTALPRRCSYDVDHWGYANNYGGHNNRFTPNTTTDFKTYTLTPPTGGQYREVSWPYTKAFTIKKITNPMGVNTTFEFEPNKITADTIGGGIRIKTITINDPVTGQKYIRRFDYSLSSTRSSGTIFRKPSYWTPILNEYNILPSGKSVYYAGDNASNNNLAMGPYCKYSQSPLPLQDYQGYAVGYTQVKEYFSSDSSNGYKIYTYQAKPKPTVTTRLQVANYTTAGVPNGNWSNITPDNLSYADPNKRGKLYPFEPLQTDLYNGLLIKQETYNNNGKLIQSTINTYSDNYADSNWFRGFIADRISYKGKNVYPFAYYKYRIGVVKLLNQKTTIIDSITGKTSTIITQYAYESANHLQPTRQITVNSTGDTTENVIRYSFDFDNNAISGGIISEMKNQNILTPLRVESWKKNNLIGCNSTEYAKNTIGTNTEVVPIKTYVLETKKKLGSTDVGFNKSFVNNISSLNGSSLLIKLQSFYSYNDKGLIKQQGKINDIPQSYIWDYNNTLPIAVASNAAPEEIAYTSFEADGTGGWTVAALDRNNTTSVTGTKSYDLSKGIITKVGLNSSKNYWVSYWTTTGSNVIITGASSTIQGPTKNGWTLWKKKITGSSFIIISGSGIIDELRLYPDGSQMISYTYIPGIGVSSQVDNNNNIILYNYDSLGRLQYLMDGDKNIVKTYHYNYAGSAFNNTLFKNTAFSITNKKNDCSSGYVGSSVTYTVPQGKYISLISQADANTQAQMDLYTNGQKYANANGTCTTTYVQLSYENIDTLSSNYITADIVVRFYQNAACTVPANVTNLDISYYIQTACTGRPTAQGSNLYINGNGTYTYIQKNAVIYRSSYLSPPDIIPLDYECHYDYFLNPGKDYISKSGPIRPIPSP